MNKYPISSYNKYVSLKVDGIMLIIGLYLFKPYFLAIVSIAYRKDRSAIIHMFYPDELLVTFEAVAAIPMLFLVYAWSRRNPEATPMVKNIWNRGKELIIMTAFFQLCVTTSSLWLPIDHVMTRTDWVQVMICLSIIIITPFSTYMRDCFADFPEKDQHG